MEIKKSLMVLGMAAILAFAAMLAVAPVYAADFEATITITGNLNIYLGDMTTLTADWSTNKDVTRSEWSVDGVGQGEVNLGGTTSGSPTFDFTPVAVGSYVISFRIWHHSQSDRDESESVTIVVSAPEYPAAPDIANTYLDKIEYPEEGRGWIISAVTEVMSPGNVFQGLAKTDAGYRAAVEAFVAALLAPPE